MRHFEVTDIASNRFSMVLSLAAVITREPEMPSTDTAVIVLAGIGFFAAFVNGAIGYGFSSLTVPVALVFYANRILNPAVVVIEVFINLYVLLIRQANTEHSDPCHEARCTRNQ